MFIGLDLGTTNVKAIVADESGKVVARASERVDLLHVGDRGVEQDIEETWTAARSVVAQLAVGADLARVRAVGVSSQGGALQMLNGDGRPVGRMISWLDGRAEPWNRRLTERLGEEWFAEHVGHGSSGTALGQLLRLREERPTLLDPPYQVGFLGDVIVSRLCGRRAHDATSLSLALLLNPSLQQADPAVLREMGLAEDRLPELLDPRSEAGPLLPEFARRAGLPVGIPVSPAVHDQYAAAVGCGAVHPGDVMLGAGTAWVLLAVGAELMRPVIPEAFVCSHLVEGLYGQILSLVNGGSVFGWALRNLGITGGEPEEVDAILRESPPGANGVMFWPFLSPGGGARLAPGTAGKLCGLRLSHGRADLLRAVVEGLTFELARYLGFLTDAGMEVDRLIMCGGAAAARLTPRIIAGITGLPIACIPETETSALGAGVVARGLLEKEAGLDALSEEMTPDEEVVRPGPDAERYAELFERYVESLPASEREEST